MKTVFEFKPKNGGNLFSNFSSDEAGMANYVIKRDWRRDQDGEMRREGYDYFWPNTSIAIGNQPFPNNATAITDIVSITRSGTLATVDCFSAHNFSEGETVNVAGANQAPYNGNFVISNVTKFTFQYTMASDPGATATGTITIKSAMPINLLHMARRPNGKTAVIAGTATHLFRFFAMDNGDYFAGNNTSSEYIYMSDTDDPGPPLGTYPYMLDNPGEWIVIGSGFNASGQRWEAVDINGYTILNNGVDLPVTYRVEETACVPIYELREQGISAVGTIAEFNGILMCGDIQEIHSSKIEELFAFLGTTSSGRITATQAGNTVTSTDNFFTSSMVSRHLIYSDGTTRQITAFTDAKNVTVDGGALTFTIGKTFKIRTKASQTGDTVTALKDMFTTEMVGRYIIFDGGQTRKITQYTSATVVKVSPSVNVASNFISLDNINSYKQYTDTEYVNRIQYRVLWGMPNEPRRFGALIPGTILAASNTLTLKYPVKSFKAGQSVLVVGAGASGGNLTATIQNVAQQGKVLILSATASTSVTDGGVQQSDAIGSIIGYEDLQDDSSGILRMLDLMESLVIYKDTSIFLATYTGNADEPFIFRRIRTPPGKNLFYRYTLASVSGLFHVFAGKNSFYRFDLTNRVPQEIPMLEGASDLFFAQATLANKNSIYVADNALTKELFFSYPSSSAEKMLCFDYKFGSVSTSGMIISAGATVKKPASGASVGETEDWFVMGTSSGAVLLYGRTDQAQGLADWNNGKEIYFRRGANPYSATKGSYDSVLKSGLEAFGDAFNEKELTELVPLLHSKSAETTLLYELFGARNPSEGSTSLLQKTLSTPNSKNLIAQHYLKTYFQDQYTVSGIDNPVKLAARMAAIRLVHGESQVRRQ